MSDKKMNILEEQKNQMLDGLEKGKKRDMVSAVLENYIAESNKRTLQESGTAGSSTTGNFARYDRLFMPLIRRVTPALMAMELVGNQPLPGPTGMARTLRFRYSNNVAASADPGGDGVTAGTEASGTVVYERYSAIAVGEAIDASDDRNPFEQTEALEGQGGNRMSLDVVKQTVEAKTRKLSAIWSLEADQDAKSLDGLDIENEMTVALADEITRELDRELLTELTNLAGTTDSFDFTLADGRYAGEKFTALTIGFSDLSNRVAIKTKRGGATWMVVSPNVLVALRNANNNAFVPATASADISPRQSLFAGTLNGNMKVFVDVYADADSVLMGYKGASELDTGFVYCPYVPIMSSGVVTDPESFDPRISLMTRYAFAKFTDSATSLGNSADFYARAALSNLVLGFTSGS